MATVRLRTVSSALPEEHSARLVGFQSLFFPQLLEVKMVSGAGEHGIQGHLARYPVVAVPG